MIRLSLVLSLLTTRNSISPSRSSLTAGYISCYTLSNVVRSLKSTYLFREWDNSRLAISLWSYSLRMRVLDALAWAFAAQLVCSFALRLWEGISIEDISSENATYDLGS